MANATGTKGRRLGVALALALVCATTCIGVSSAAATSLPLAIAPVSADVPISAGGGWLIWSVPVHRDWGLETYHDGTLAGIPVAARPQPFDMSVGSDSRGAPVATFSRCTRTPKMEVVGSEAIGGSLLVPRSGTGCRLHILELASGRESTLPIPHPADSSDTTPSIWHGNVAFARKAHGHSDISQIMLWSPKHPHTLRSLPSGTVPTCPTKGRCARQGIRGEVQALDLDGDIVTFLWAVDGPRVIGHGGWEVRVDDLANARSSLAGSGVLTEACAGGGTELERLEPPVAVGDSVLFSEFTRSSCYHEFTSLLHSYRTGAVHPSSGALPGILFGLAKDRKTIYALAAPTPTPEFQTDPRCSPTAPCTLEQIEQPRLSPTRFKPHRLSEDSQCPERVVAHLARWP